MAYDEKLAARLREVLAGEPGLSEKRMFGGLAFLVNGNMAVAASGQGGLMLRTDPARTEAILREPHAEPMVMRGREMVGWMRLEPDGCEADGDLERWVAIGVAHARSLPPKQPPKQPPGPAPR